VNEDVEAEGGACSLLQMLRGEIDDEGGGPYVSATALVVVTVEYGGGIVRDYPGSNEDVAIECGTW